jgi:plasmid maintenance system antidote protein VapI
MKEEEVHIGELIKQRLKEEKRSVAWLAKKLNRSDSSLGRLLCQDHIHAELLFRISIILDEDLFAHYSQALKEKEKLQKPQ